MHEFRSRASKSLLDFLVTAAVTILVLRTCILFQSGVSNTVQKVDLADGWLSAWIVLAKQE
jgi:hypothetical protein